MHRNVKFALVLALAAVAPPATALLATESVAPLADEGGLCQELGCRNGPTKCADGVLTTSGGTVIPYTCYTTIAEM